MSSADRTEDTRHGTRQRDAARWIVFTGIVFVLTVVFAFVVLGVGAYPFGNANDADLCRVTQPLPQVGGPYDAPDSRATAQRTWFPLGVVCTLDSQHDAVGPQVTHHQSQLATWTWLGASTIAVGELILLLLITRSELRRRRAR